MNKGRQASKVPGREAGVADRAVDAVDARSVAAYLRDHPNFFAEHLDLLADLPPSPMIRPDGVIDLRAVTVERLKQDSSQLTDQFEEILETGRTNQTLLNRTHAAVLRIIEARDFESFIQAVTTDLAVVIDVDAAVLIVEADGAERPVFEHAGLRLVDAGILPSQAVALEGNMMGDERIFGPAAGLVRSQALIGLSIGQECPDCMLALGSRDPDMFSVGMRTDLLQFLARVTELGFRRYLGWDI